MMDESDMKLDNDSTISSLLSINSLKYTLPEQLSVVTARSIQSTRHSHRTIKAVAVRFIFAQKVVPGSSMGETRGFGCNLASLERIRPSSHQDPSQIAFDQWSSEVPVVWKLIGSNISTC